MQNCMKELPLLSSRLGKAKAHSEIFQVTGIVESNVKTSIFYGKRRSFEESCKYVLTNIL